MHAGMTPEQILRALWVTSKGELVAPRELLESLIASDEGALARLDALLPASGKSWSSSRKV